MTDTHDETPFTDEAEAPTRTAEEVMGGLTYEAGVDAPDAHIAILGGSDDHASGLVAFEDGESWSVIVQRMPR
jgi:hypothetical protein